MCVWVGVVWVYAHEAQAGTPHFSHNAHSHCGWELVATLTGTGDMATGHTPSSSASNLVQGRLSPSARVVREGLGGTQPQPSTTPKKKMLLCRRRGKKTFDLNSVPLENQAGMGGGQTLQPNGQRGRLVDHPTHHPSGFGDSRSALPSTYVMAVRQEGRETRRGATSAARWMQFGKRKGKGTAKKGSARGQCAVFRGTTTRHPSARQPPTPTPTPKLPEEG